MIAHDLILFLLGITLGATVSVVLFRSAIKTYRRFHRAAISKPP